MPLTIERALSLDVLKNTYVIAGKEGLNNVINYVNVMEVPDVFNWASKGELIITTGYPFKDSPLELVTLITKLSEKKIAGILIKTKRFIDELPKEVLSKADELNIPLISLPPDAVFTRIISGIMAQIISEDYCNIKKLMEIHNNIANAIISGGSLQEIAIALSVACNGDIEINDSSHHSIAIAYEYTETDSNNKAHPVDTYQKALMVSTEAIGSVQLTSYRDKINEESRLVIDNTSNVLAMILYIRETKNEKQKRHMICFLNDIINGKIESEDILHERAEEFGVNMKIPYVSYVFAPDCDGDNLNEIGQFIKAGHFEQLVTDAFELFGTRCICWTYRNKVCAFASVQAEVDDVTAESVTLGKRVHKYISDSVKNSRFSIGIGTCYFDNMNLFMSFSDALKATEAGKMTTRKYGVFHYEKIGIYQILYQLVDSEAGIRYVNNTLGKLIKYDGAKKTQLLLTLEQFLYCKSLEDASKKLYIHPKTLALRKTKIERILDVKLDSQEVSLSLLAAIKLYRMIEERSKDSCTIRTNQ